MRPGTIAPAADGYTRVQYGRGDEEWVEVPASVTVCSPMPDGWRLYIPGGVIRVECTATRPLVTGESGNAEVLLQQKPPRFGIAMETATAQTQPRVLNYWITSGGMPGTTPLATGWSWSSTANDVFLLSDNVAARGIVWWSLRLNRWGWQLVASASAPAGSFVQPQFAMTRDDAADALVASLRDPNTVPLCGDPPFDPPSP
ncbi:MAG: hypothetical protein KGL39_46850 [Patescibacteria group bacterium]|nr:hypothetical protein [Patescibacteria group bacterium]